MTFSTTEPLGIQTGHKIVFTKMKRSFTFGVKRAYSSRVINQTLTYFDCFSSLYAWSLWPCRTAFSYDRSHTNENELLKKGLNIITIHENDVRSAQHMLNCSALTIPRSSLHKRRPSDWWYRKPEYKEISHNRRKIWMMVVTTPNWKSRKSSTCTHSLLTTKKNQRKYCHLKKEKLTKRKSSMKNMSNSKLGVAAFLYP